MRILAPINYTATQNCEGASLERRFPSGYLDRLSALVDGNVVPRVVAQINLARTSNFLLWIQKHLFPLRNPAGSARNGEQNREHGHREAHRLVDQARIEIHVGVELALDEVFVFQRNALAFQRDFEKWILAHQVEHLIGDVLDDARAGVVILVNTMAEAHELHFARFDPPYEFRNLLHGTDFHEHAEHFFIGAPMERAIQRGNGGGRGGVRIDVRTAYAANRVRRAILFMVGM